MNSFSSLLEFLGFLCLVGVIAVFIIMFFTVGDHHNRIKALEEKVNGKEKE